MARALAKPKEKTTPSLITIGTTGLRHHAGIIDEEFHPRLRGQRAVDVFIEMRDNDAVIGSMLYAIESLLRQVKWSVSPADDSEKSKQAAAFLDDVILNMSHSWEDLITEILSMLVFGWSFLEIVYKKRDDGKIAWRKLSIRSQETLSRWEIDNEDGGIRGLWQRDYHSGAEVFIPIEKALLFRTTSLKNNPEGRSILRNAYRSWWYLKRIQNIEAVGIERDLSGLPVMQVPPDIMSPNASSDQKALRSSLELLIQQLRRDEREGVVIPAEETRDGLTGYKLNLLKTGGSRAVNAGATIKRYESRMAMSVLAEFILLGTEQVGSYALASSKTGLFTVTLGRYLSTIKSVFNRFAIPRLFAFNPEFPKESWPTLEHGDIERPDLKDLSEYVKRLVSVEALTPDRAMERTLRETADLPLVEDE